MGDLLELMGLSREWPEVFDEIVALVSERLETTEERDSQVRREQLLALARRRFGQG